MRFWLLDLPAVIVGLIFKAYTVFLGVITILCFGAVIYSLMALAVGWPRIW